MNNKEALEYYKGMYNVAFFMTAGNSIILFFANPNTVSGLTLLTWLPVINMMFPIISIASLVTNYITKVKPNERRTRQHRKTA